MRKTGVGNKGNSLRNSTGDNVTDKLRQAILERRREYDRQNRATMASEEALR